MPIRVTNIEAGYYDKRGFHPLRRSLDYDPDRAGDDYSSQRDSMGLRYERKSKAKRAHRFVRGTAVNPQRRAAKLIPVRWSPAKVRRLKSGAVQVMIRNPGGGDYYHVHGHLYGDRYYNTLAQAKKAARRVSETAGEEIFLWDAAGHVIGKYMFGRLVSGSRARRKR